MDHCIVYLYLEMKQHYEYSKGHTRQVCKGALVITHRIYFIVGLTYNATINTTTVQAQSKYIFFLKAKQCTKAYNHVSLVNYVNLHMNKFIWMLKSCHYTTFFGVFKL